jgi:cell division protein FtsQ
MEEKKSTDINIVISSEHKILSNPELIREKFQNLLNGENLDFNLLTDDLYKNTWIYAFQSKKRWPNRYDIKVKEHQPVAKWGEKNYLTHSGILINPSINDSYVHLVVLKGKESEKFLLLDISRQIQNQLNRYNETIKEVNLSSGGVLLISTEKGTELVFTKKDFREQLERLEDFISFELFSGKLNNIRNMDFRYKKGIAVLFS